MAKMLRKAQKRLNARIAQYNTLFTDSGRGPYPAGKVTTRIERGGYRKPGSMKGRR
jgi:hypothetical protein